jgi:hypothetical protein
LTGLAGQYIYAGIGSPSQIDWQGPLGWAPASCSTAKINLPLQPSQKYACGVRAISAEGTEEHNTHIVCFAEVDTAGSLQPAPLPIPRDIVARRIDSDLVRLGFTSQAGPGYATPASFDILWDSGSGMIDENNPHGTLAVTEPDQAEFIADIAASTFPSKFALRPRLGTQLGPISDIVTIAQNRQPPPPISL